MDRVAFDFVMPLPMRHPVMDIFQLTNGRSELVVAFLEGLLAGELSLELPVDFKTTKWAFENHVEVQNRTRLYGGHWLWFGFPLLQIGDAKKSILSPLWLWPISLKPPQEQDKGWILQLTETLSPQANPQLDRLFREKLGWQQKISWWHSVQGAPLDMSRLSRLVQDLMEQLAIESPSQSVSISPWTSANLSTMDAHSARLIWSGLIGQFPGGYPAENPNTATHKAQTVAPSAAHPFGLLSRDPWQETALEEARRQKGILIRGRSGSGKTALLQDVLLNALSNGERCLVLSSRLEVLSDLQRDLIRLGLEKLLVFFHQTPEESALVLQMLKAAAKEKKKTTFASNQFTQLLAQLHQEKSTLDLVYQAANKRIYGPYTWTQTVGLYLSASRLESKALLASQLNAQDFNLIFDQYQAMCEQLSRSQVLFEDVNTLTHPLTVLNAGIFVHQEKEEAHAFILGKIKEFSERGAALQYRYILEQNDYGDRLAENYEQFYRKILDQVSSLQEKILSYRKHYGQDPLESTRTTLKLYARFSDKFKKTLAAKEEIAKGYEQLEKTFRASSYLQHDFLPIGERHFLTKLLTNLELLQQQLRQWREQLGSSVQDELVRLSSKTVQTDLAGSQIIGELEKRLDLLVEELNDSGLLQLPLENKNLTLPRRQRFLEEIMEKLERLRYNMRDFDHFFEWQRYWFGLPAEARRIITALVKVKPNDWSAAFSSWYLHHQLLVQAEANLPESPLEIKNFSEKLQVWRQQLIPQIIDLWADRRIAVLQKLKKEQRFLWDQLMAKKDQEKDQGLEAFTGILSQFFPLIFASPYVSYDFLAPDEPYDCVLVEESHLLDPSLLEIWRNRAKRMVLFANPNYEPKELAGWVRRQAWPQVTLQATYRSSTPDLQVEEVVGRYNARQEINDEEARKLLNLLNIVEENPQRTLPRVTIVCFTRAQRNLLYQYLDRIKRQRLAGVEKIQQLERNGFGIYTPDELYGLHTDILLVSCTYGLTGATDQLTTDLSHFNEVYRPGIVELLRTRARQSTIVLHSIPADDLNRMAKDPISSNLSDLANWLLIPPTKSYKLPSAGAHEETAIHPLASEIAWQIADQVRTDRLAFQVPFGSTVLPMTVAPLKGAKARAVLLNGFVAETPATSYEWEWTQQLALQEAGFDLHPIWSVAWWKRPAQEAASFSTVVNAISSEEE